MSTSEKILSETLKSIKAAMARQGISSPFLAKKLGIPYSTIRHILTGRTQLKMKMFYQILEALELTPEEFFCGGRIHQVGVANVVGDGNHVVAAGDGGKAVLTSSGAEGRKWESLFYDCQAKLKKCIDARTRLTQENALLKKELDAAHTLINELQQTKQLLIQLLKK